MTIKTVTALAVAASVLALSTAAEAGNKSHGRHYGNGHIQFFWGGHRHFDHIFESPRCRYFFRKARRTGHRHWWKKYRRCISYDRHY